METMSTLHLRGSFPRLRQYMQLLPHAVLLVDEAGRVTEVNEALLRVTGYSRGDLVSQSIHTILPRTGTVRSMYDEHLKSSMLNATHTEFEWRSKQGTIGKSVAMMIKLEMEKVYYVIHLFQLTKDMNQSLTQKYVGQLTSDINLGVVVLDKEGHIVEISQLACKLLGVDRTDIINLHIDQVFRGVPEEHRLVQREVMEGVKIHNKAMSWTNDRQRYELLVDSNTLQDETGRTVGAYVIFKDVTNLRSLEQKIERSDRLAMIGQIAAGTAHEIRNPLTSIKGFLQMFLQSFTENNMSRERDYTEIMLTEINRINSLVSEFLLLSKPRDIQYQMVDLNTVFSEMMPIVESQALLHGIDVQCTGEGQLPMVVGDAELLKQVFLNICKNGLEAMGHEGTLYISHHVEPDRDKISINIRDTGPGVPVYIIDRIFDPFFTTKEEGTGLGLSVCQKIIHDIGGQIRVSSKGYGTTFHILLPYI